jgi:hypothetical protein
MFLLSLALLAAPATADPAAPKVEASKDAEVVCRHAKSTGSRLRAPKICKTRAEWKEQDASSGAGDFGDTRVRSTPR